MSEDVTLVEVPLSAAVLEAVDAWIDRHEDPKPTRGEAVAQLVAGRLGAELPSTVIPNLVTGRDIV